MSVSTRPDDASSGRLGSFAAYGAARTVVEALLAVRGVVLATVLGPTSFGVWTLFRLTLRYGAFAAMGIHRGIEVEVAGLPRESAAAARREWGRSSVGYLLVVYSVLGTVALTSSLLFGPPTRETLWAVAVGLVLERLWVYGSSYLRAEGRLGRFAAVELTHAASSLLLTTVLALAWGLAGAYAGFMVAMGFAIALLGRSVPFRPRVSVPRVRHLLGVGVPLSLAAIVNTLMTTADRLIVAALAGTETLGFYAFAVATSGLGASAAWVVRTVVFPDVYARARREGGRVAAEEHLHNNVVPVAVLLPPLLGFAALALGPVIVLIAPGYEGVIPVARLFMFTGAAAGIMTLGTLGLVAMQRQRLVPMIATGGLAMNVTSAFAALQAGLGLLGVAAGVLASRSLTAFGIVALASGVSGSVGMGRLALQLLGPVTWCATVVAILGWQFPDHGLASTAVATFLYSVALVPLAPALHRAFQRMRGTPVQSGDATPANTGGDQAP